VRYQDTIASECRYGEYAAVIWRDMNILWEQAENSYQGYACLLGEDSEGRIHLGGWVYGSCSGCDDWEFRNASSEEIVEDMRRAVMTFDSPQAYLEWHPGEQKKPTTSDDVWFRIPPIDLFDATSGEM
jgi:hypothetical protein